jgi:para-nitrobenzyl esterase
MRRQGLVVLLVLAVACGRNVVVQTKYGALEGKVDGRSVTFKGIPFAAPPVGPLRWRSPQSPSPWSGTRSAKSFAPDCLQWHNSSALAAITSEDCLYLNLWVPEKPPSSAPLPVMMFFFGGSWAWGGTQMTIYDGARMLEKANDVIICTVNYRLGPLGFIASAELSAESGTSGNYGLMDQQAAMRWVRDNAAAFGGDGKRLTIWGESAGASSVSTHLVMPSSWGLFSQAVVESGPVAAWSAKPFDIMQAVYDGMAAQFNCTTLACLRQIEGHKIQQLNNVDQIEQRVSNLTSVTTVTWSPVVDGVLLPDFPLHLLAAGKVAPVPLLVGSNLNEGTEFTPGIHSSANASTLAAWLVTMFGPDYATKVASMYPISQFQSPWWAATAMITDAFFTCPSRAMASVLSAAGAEVYVYQFTHVWDEISIDRRLGVFHGSELIGVWAVHDGLYELPDHTIIPIILSPRELFLLDDFVRYWTAFGASGNPNAKGGALWPLFNSTARMSLDISLSQRPVANLQQKQCDFWDTINLLDKPSLRRKR